MKPTTLLVFCLTTALFAGCTGNKKTHLDGASLLGYWSDTEEAIRCSEDLDCVVLRKDFEDFKEEVEARGSAKTPTELVRFEAHQNSTGKAFAGVFAERPTKHEYLSALNSQEFQAEHAERSQKKQRLVHFTVWEHTDGYRVAAIWRHPTQSENDATTWREDKVQFDLGWQDLASGPSGYYLDDIELYPSTITGNPPLIAAVWRPGTVRTKVLHDRCTLSPEALQPDKKSQDKNLPCTLPETQPVATQQNPCPVLAQIEQEAAQETEELPALRPSDFEIYAHKGEDRLAVLLQERTNQDWLMVPGSWGALDCRHKLVALDDRFTQPPGLLDLDLVSVGGKSLLGTTHEGVIHDDGTSGPPPP